MTMLREVNINVAYLISVVQEAFDNSQEVNWEVSKKSYWKRTSEEQNRIRHLSDREDGKWDAVRDICLTLGINQKNLISIARLTRRWEIRHDWQLCFPIERQKEKILAYIAEEQ